jgi:putative N-acetylmannosamine-6-phosphate epimerase
MLKFQIYQLINEKKNNCKRFKNFKGKKQFTLILVKNKEEALAADKVGIEMVGTGAAGKYTNPHDHASFEEVLNIRKAAPNAFMHYGAPDTLMANT